LIVPILCLVCLFLVFWVILLKTEISRLMLKYEGNRGGELTSKANAQDGNRSFTIG